MRGGGHEVVSSDEVAVKARPGGRTREASRAQPNRWGFPREAGTTGAR